MKNFEAGPDVSNDEARIFELIARYFLSCCSKDARGDETQVEIQIRNEFFHTTGLIVREKNYLEIYTYDNWNDNNLPNFQVGDMIVPYLFKFEEGKTTAPKYLTESELISLMDKNGIGTDATIHEHIKKVTDRGYVIKSGNMFIPTSLGTALVESY